MESFVTSSCFSSSYFQFRYFWWKNQEWSLWCGFTLSEMILQSWAGTSHSHKQQRPPCSTATCWEKECVDPSGSLSVKFGAHARKLSGLAKSFMIRSGGSIESHMQNLMTTFSHTLHFSQFTFSSGLIGPTFFGFLPRSWLSAAHGGSRQINQVYPSQMYAAASLG